MWDIIRSKHQNRNVYQVTWYAVTCGQSDTDSTPYRYSSTKWYVFVVVFVLWHSNNIIILLKSRESSRCQRSLYRYISSYFNNARTRTNDFLNIHGRLL